MKKLIIVLSILVLAHPIYAFKNDTIQFKYQKPSYLKAGLILGTAFTVGMFTDEFIANKFQANKGNIGDIYFGITDNFGDGKYVIPAALVPLAASYIIKDEKLKKTSYDALKSTFVAGLATQALKQTFGRARPFKNLGPYDFELFRMEGSGFMALPSGHTSLAFSIITPFAETYSRWLYLIPVSVGLARIYHNKHWFSDVVMGAALGYFSGVFFTYRENQKVIFSGNRLVIRF